MRKLVAVVCSMLVGSSMAMAQIAEPGGRPEDIALALSNPDEYAWKLFLFMNRQAAPNVAGVADPAKKNLTEYDADKPVVWETWAFASGADPSDVDNNKSEVYKYPATLPVEWKDLDRKTVKEPILSPNFKTNAAILDLASQLNTAIKARPDLNSRALARPADATMFAAPIGVLPSEEEVRMNESTYNTIRANQLYSVEGLEDAARTAKANGASSIVNFEPASKEIKAVWKQLNGCQADTPCAEKERYHWRIVTNPATKQREAWGLVALHIITKDLPNWFWADFGHIDCEAKSGSCSAYRSDGSSPLHDSTTGTANPGGIGPAGKNGQRNETLKSKWQNYRLRGTQTAFTTTEGRPTILSNPVIESSFQKSSCMSCHARATIGLKGVVADRGTSLAAFSGLDVFARNIGSPPGAKDVIGGRARDVVGFETIDCLKFQAAGATTCPDDREPAQTVYFQTDFLWSLPMRTFSKVKAN